MCVTTSPDPRGVTTAPVWQTEADMSGGESPPDSKAQILVALELKREDLRQARVTESRVRQAYDTAKQRTVAVTKEVHALEAALKIIEKM